MYIKNELLYTFGPMITKQSTCFREPVSAEIKLAITHCYWSSIVLDVLKAIIESLQDNVKEFFFITLFFN